MRSAAALAQLDPRTRSIRSGGIFHWRGGAALCWVGGAAAACVTVTVQIKSECASTLNVIHADSG